MAIVALLDPEASVPLQVGWALWFARARAADVTLLLSDDASARSPEVVRAQVIAQIGQDERFVFADGDEHEHERDRSAGDASEPDPPLLRARVAAARADDAEAMLQAVQQAAPEQLLVLVQKVDSTDARVRCIGREVLPRLGCAVALVDLGDERWPVAHLLVAASRGAHPRMALRAARELARDVGGRLTGAYVEPDIGSDAPSVGRHVLDRVLRAAFGEDARDVGRRVVVAENVEAGLHKAVEVAEPDAIVLGLPRPGLLGPRFFGLVPARLCRRVSVPVVMLREALPLGNRLRRTFEDVLQRFVPQVEREVRVELAARVQSSSAWNFDFVALISLSTLIAALGLLQNSAAVIIGAMLIAPLMTPILGVGLALAQGNARLAKLAFRTIAFGVVTSFALAAGVGWLDGSVHLLDTTPEMLARGWPGLFDLFVACVSGLAAAYAMSRPGLVAALPGVAIAAALVPPIAVSGLATARGEWSLAYGAFLLFFTNMVAIVLAAGLSLWAVGVRGQERSGWRRHLGNAFVAAVLVLGV
ncbi:MAG TPA: DUF389 domain-containing protein, partial [bacterium]|nr:DUF389 domain-containing protein [bacterium]